ncbi:hypothetical protein CMO96_05140 [Candidatus Woesebacteria bacterium]|nr:hypothetical protein [Candidatus Woesebacteria bacterium]
MKKYKLVYVEWHDAISNEGISAWKTAEEVKEWGEGRDWIVENVGWLLEETKEYIVLAAKKSDKSSDDYDQQYGCLFKIPRTWIRKKKVLKI